MTATDTPASARRRLLDTAAELFYRYGVNTVGVDRVSAEAGVSKRTLYQLFGDKAGLVAAALEDKGPQTLGIYIPAENPDSSPRERILAVFDSLRAWSATPEFRGCPFMNVASELYDAGHPARAVARTYKLQLRDYLARQAKAGGATDPQALAEQLLMLFDGAIAQALINNGPVPDTTPAAANALLNAHAMPADGAS